MFTFLSDLCYFQIFAFANLVRDFIAKEPNVSVLLTREDEHVCQSMFGVLVVVATLFLFRLSMSHVPFFFHVRVVTPVLCHCFAVVSDTW